MKPSLSGPIKATAAMVAIISGVMFTNAASADHNALAPVAVNLASDVTDS